MCSWANASICEDFVEHVLWPRLFGLFLDVEQMVDVSASHFQGYLVETVQLIPQECVHNAPSILSPGGVVRPFWHLFAVSCSVVSIGLARSGLWMGVKRMLRTINRAETFFTLVFWQTTLRTISGRKKCMCVQHVAAHVS